LVGKVLEEQIRWQIDPQACIAYLKKEVLRQLLQQQSNKQHTIIIDSDYCCSLIIVSSQKIEFAFESVLVFVW